jgi:uncharacterized membrane protein YphA (DoxX/SURF4 family)
MPARWSFGKRVAFRFAFLVGALQILPFPFGVIPGTGAIAALVYHAWRVAVGAFGDAIGIPDLVLVHNGSGDQTWHYVQLLLVAVLATAGTLVWSIADRRRTSYERLAAIALVVLRYFLAMMLILYGLAKVFEIQFISPSPARLDGRIGDMSPMGVLWTFMGASRPYTIFAGWLEIIPGLLLLWRRTALIGALASIVVMINIVALNFSYDVPVKLFSLQLLAIGIAIALPQAFRLLVAALGYPVPYVPPRVRMTPSWERARRIAKLVMLGSIAIYLVALVAHRHDMPPRTALHGIWEVETFIADGRDRPPLLTDLVRWRKLIVTHGFVGIRGMDDTRVFHRAEIDSSTIRLAGDQDDLWRYTRSADRLAIEGRYQGRALRITLRLEPEPLLTSRGFRWINEEPFNR